MYNNLKILTPIKMYNNLNNPKNMKRESKSSYILIRKQLKPLMYSTNYNYIDVRFSSRWEEDSSKRVKINNNPSDIFTKPLQEKIQALFKFAEQEYIFLHKYKYKIGI